MGNKVVENDTLDMRIRAQRQASQREIIRRELGEEPKLAHGGYDSGQLKRARKSARDNGTSDRYSSL